jgi:hypothetical protein
MYQRLRILALTRKHAAQMQRSKQLNTYINEPKVTNMQKFAYAAAALVAVAGTAHAEMRPYVGADYVYTHADYNRNIDDVADDGLHGVNPYAGLQFNKYVGAEIGYLHTQTGKKEPVAGIDTKMRLKGWSADLVGTYPVTADESLALLGTVGVGRYSAKGSVDVPGVATFTDTEKDTALRLGVGAQYQINPCWGVRAMARWIDADFGGATDQLVQGTIGLNYKF